jgi:5-hmdU DNA kinase-like protein
MTSATARSPAGPGDPPTAAPRPPSSPALVTVRRPPVPRWRIYDMYWRFAAERQAVFERRVAGQPPPWTSDPIMQRFKFCNVFRAADRISLHMIREVCYHREPCTPADRAFQIVAFRAFSKIETWRVVREVLGRHPLLADLADGSFTHALDQARARNGGLYTGAFILCATDAYSQGAKHRNHVELFRHMFLRDDLGDRLPAAHSLAEVYGLLRRYPLMGDFMSYQTAVDLNYSDLLGFGENDFTQPGPGALRGLRKVFEDLGDYTPAGAVMWMTGRQQDEFARLGLRFSGLWGRPLHAIDCQGLFCETDKYCRQAAPELASSRTRIKARFKTAPDPVRLFFPPRWQLNGRLPTGPVLGSRAGQQRLF